uniref:Sperm microtubule associated protein 2 n=1 Tax=Rhinolophus ferrumequinum TaxID=59479 RepID=A0A671E525_RHIFE
MARRRKKGRRLFELAKPKTNWHVLKDRCPRCPGQPRWPSPVQGLSSWQSPGHQRPCWKSGTLCRNPSHMCQTTTGFFTWPCRRPSQRSVFLTEIHTGGCWTSPRRRWPVPGSSPWPSPDSARISTKATTGVPSPV